MKMQFEANTDKEIQDAIRNIHIKFPLPKGMQFLLCNENSELFWVTF